jgi:hypothetical protein
MSRKLMGIALAIGLLIVPLSTWASDKGAGCGLGKVVFEGQSGFLSHSTAMTTNGLGTGYALTTQSVGMTVGTLGCDTSKAVDAQSVERDVFVAVNLENLSQDMAMGAGEHLNSLASLMGCGESAYSEFGQMTRDNYAALMERADQSSTELVSGLQQQISTHPALASRCARVS